MEEEVDGARWKGEGNVATFTGLLVMRGIVSPQVLVYLSPVLQLAHNHPIFFTRFLHPIHHLTSFAETSLLCTVT